MLPLPVDAGPDQVDVEDVRVRVDQRRLRRRVAPELGRRVAQPSLQVEVSRRRRPGRRGGCPVGDRQRRRALGDAVRPVGEVRRVDRDRGAVERVGERRPPAGCAGRRAGSRSTVAVHQAAERREARTGGVGDGVAGLEPVHLSNTTSATLHDVHGEVVLRTGVLSVVADRALGRVERQVAGVDQRRARQAASGRRRTVSRAVPATMSPVSAVIRVCPIGFSIVPLSTMSGAAPATVLRFSITTSVGLTVRRRSKVRSTAALEIDERSPPPPTLILLTEVARRQVGDRHTGIGVGELEQRLEVVAASALSLVILSR